MVSLKYINQLAFCAMQHHICLMQKTRDKQISASVNPGSNIGFSIRHLWPMDIASYREHLLRLDPESRYSRFGGSVSDTYINDYVDTALRPDTLIYGAFNETQLIAAGELRILFGTWPLRAETAFSVEKLFQDHGLGDQLLSRIITAARNRGVTRLGMQCLSHNQRMRHLAQKHHAEMTTADGETEAQLIPLTFNPISLFEEWMGEADGTISRLNPWKQAGLQ